MLLYTEQVSKKEHNMSTNAYIGIEHANGTVSVVYSHSDGYVAGLGVELVNNYCTRPSAAMLVSLGDMSYPGRSYVSQGERFADVKPSITDSVEQFAAHNSRNYRYLFSRATNSWVFMAPGTTHAWTGLATVVAREGFQA
tara:strand:+ start:165 stop:584 length:420 start_codon:yes stop_codon:yes gene_type:complete